jgi:hypothetical protein
MPDSPRPHHPLIQPSNHFEQGKDEYQDLIANFLSEKLKNKLVEAMNRDRYWSLSSNQGGAAPMSQ